MTTQTGSDESALHALAPEIPSVEIEGRTYQMRRLGLLDAMLGLRVFSAASGGVLRVSGSDGLSEETLAFALLGALPYAQDPVEQLLAGVLQVEKKQLEDPDQFPMGSFVKIVEALSKHPDLTDFLDSVGSLRKTKLFKEIQNRAKNRRKSEQNQQGSS